MINSNNRRRQQQQQETLTNNDRQAGRVQVEDEAGSWKLEVANPRWGSTSSNPSVMLTILIIIHLIMIDSCKCWCVSICIPSSLPPFLSRSLSLWFCVLCSAGNWFTVNLDSIRTPFSINNSLNVAIKTVFLPYNAKSNHKLNSNSDSQNRKLSLYHICRARKKKKKNLNANWGYKLYKMPTNGWRDTERLTCLVIAKWNFSYRICRKLQSVSTPLLSLYLLLLSAHSSCHSSHCAADSPQPARSRP